jgi:hypothetical protein
MSPVVSPYCCDKAMTLMAVISPVGGPYELRIYVCPLAPSSAEQSVLARRNAPILEAGVQRLQLLEAQHK